MIQEVVLLTRAEPLPERGVNPSWGPTARYYNPMPKKLTIRVSLDAWHWDTVFETDNLQPPKTMGEAMHFRFPIRRVKQIWIIGEMFDLMVTGPFMEFWVTAGLSLKFKHWTMPATIGRSPRSARA